MRQKKTVTIYKTKITKKRVKLKVQRWVVEPLYKRLGGLIAAERSYRGMRQEDLAKKIGISRAALANMEAGRQRILLHHVFAVEKAFGVYNDLINQARGNNTT